MKVVFTETALKDLDDTFEYRSANYPTLVAPVEKRIHALIAHLSRWPESARAVEQRPRTRVAPLVRYPYRIFYRVTDEAVEIVHIHHASRRPWDAEP